MLMNTSQKSLRDDCVLNLVFDAINDNARLILLTGQTASARNHILQRWAQGFREAGAEYCLLSDEYSVLETEEELYRGLAKGFCLEDKPLELLEDLVERVEHFIEVAISEDRLIVIAGGGSHDHATGVLADLLQLASSHKGLRLILSGEESLLESIDTFHTESFGHHHINLADFSGDEFMELSSPPLVNVRKTALRLPDGLSVKHLLGMAVAILFTVAVILFYPDDHMNTETSSIAQPPAPMREVMSAEPVIPDAGQPVSLPVEPDPVYYSDQEQLLLEQSPDSLALQVAILSSEQAASEFIAGQEVTEQQLLHYYQRGRDEKVVWVVVYGNYADKSAAMTALETLPSSLRKASPWPRPFADIQQDIKNRISHE